jgi:hypothetical protein
MTSRRFSLCAVTALLLTACGGNGEADKPATQVLSDASQALKSATSFHLAVLAEGGGQSGRVEIGADVVSPSTVSGTIKQGGVTGHFVFAGGRVYLQGRQFLTALAGAQTAETIGDRWVIAPSSAATSGIGQIADMQKFATCLVENHGTLSKSSGSVNGQDAVVLTDKADRPGTQPGKLYVAASGTAYPLKLEITGPTTPGTPTNSACSSTGSSTGSLTFSDYGKSFSIAAPSGAVDMSGGR